MEIKTIVMCVVALILGMLLANMLKSVCGCKNIIEGQRWHHGQHGQPRPVTMIPVHVESHFPHQEEGG